MPDTSPGPLTDAGRHSGTITGAMAETNFGEPTVEEMSKPPSLLDNKNNGGHNPYMRRTTQYPRKPVFTIGTRGQENGETG